jgi:hypothetical protein
VRRLGRLPLPAAGVLAVAGVLLGILIGGGLADERGDAVGLAAAGFYATLFAVAALRWDDLVAWGKRHPVADRSLILPLAFFTVALLTNFPLLVCAAIALAGTVVFVVLGTRGARRG